MENKDTNTDYQKFIRVGDQTWEILGVFFCFCFAWDLYLLFFIQGVFMFHLKKSPHLKCQLPPKIQIWPISIQYKRSEKWLSPPSPPPNTHSPITQGGRGGGGVQTMNA